MRLHCLFHLHCCNWRIWDRATIFVRSVHSALYLYGWRWAICSVLFWLCMCVHVHTCAHVHAPKRPYVEVRGWCKLLSLAFLFFEIGSQWAQTSSFQLPSCLVSKLQRSICLQALHFGVIDWCCPVYGCLGSELSSSCSHRKYFTLWAISLAQIVWFFFGGGDRVFLCSPGCCCPRYRPG